MRACMHWQWPRLSDRAWIGCTVEPDVQLWLRDLLLNQFQRLVQGASTVIGVLGVHGLHSMHRPKGCHNPHVRIQDARAVMTTSLGSSSQTAGPRLLH